MSDEGEDVIKPICDHGDGSFTVERHRNGETELGVLQTGVEGRPIPPGVELLDISRRGDTDTYDARVMYKMAGGNGPAQVATPKYKAGWDAVFSKPNADLN